jgi:polyhydroxyalkanoate synthesis regulator phasin
MNANDLADRLEEFYTGTHIVKAAETLRQQQAEIEALIKQIQELQNAIQ